MVIRQRYYSPETKLAANSIKEVPVIQIKKLCLLKYSAYFVRSNPPAPPRAI